MATSRKGGKVQSKIQMLLYGQQGCGKSTISSQLLYLKRPDGKPFRVLYLDPENGSIDDMIEDIEKDGIDTENLYIVYTQSLKEVNEYINKATNKEPFYELDEDGNETDEMILDADGEQFIPDAVVVDGTTILNLSVKQGLVEFSKKRAEVKAKRDNLLGDEKFVKVEGAGLELKDYNSIGFKGQDLVLTLTGSGLHYIITARETDEKISVKGGYSFLVPAKSALAKDWQLIFVLDGSGTVKNSDSQKFELAKEDLIAVKPGEKITIEGTLVIMKILCR